MLVYENGSISGTIGGGALEKIVIEQALEQMFSTEGVIVKHNLVNELAMCCGGSVDLFLEPIMNRFKLYIFGAGHIGKSLTKFASDLDFNITLIDERIDAFDSMKDLEFEAVQKHHIQAIDELSFDSNTCVVILTHDHAHDREILALTSKKKHAYIGMVGSARKVEIAKKALLANNLMNLAELEQINMPIGTEIKTVTPEEIAISILAKLIDARNLSRKN